ncbi:Headtail preconnector protein GP5 [Bradyrhizobium sp.]|uniref:S49 family peptidase n=1 Tax=Bradyrhizobium sp. TaxID=376 RepID=UPI0007C19B5E|nr:S49 family peptidase [Bradyrhizobium sp.]CUT12529.1 Headtail preconnector protein GP5 [Bradyrhizobium sp.]
MTLLMPHIASRMFNTPLLIDAGKLAAILTGLGARIVDGGVEFGDIVAIEHTPFAQGRPSESFGRLGDRLGRAYEQAGAGNRIFDRLGPVAVIPIEGTLIHKGAFLGQSSGETSYEGLQTRINAVRRDSSVRGVAFEVDTFGGEGAGLFDTAHMIAELSREKPTLAIVNDFAYSAGYALASAARQIVLSSAGGVGSIGVVTMHLDHSKRLERAGTKVTVIHSGKHKADGHPFGELPPEVATKIQNRVDAMRDQFAGMVAEFRGPRLSKAAALATEADVFYGEDAVKAGLADAVARPSEAFSQFVSLIR